MHGREVKKWMYIQGITQRELCKAVGLSPQLMSNVLNCVDAIENELIRRGCPLYLLCPAVIGEILEERFRDWDDNEFLEPDNAAMTPLR